MSDPSRAYLLLLGSNIDKHRNLDLARRRIAECVDILRCSRIHESDPVGATGTPRFYNQALLVATDLSPAALKQELCSLEMDLGRRRSADPNAPRSIDIDALLSLDEHGEVLSDPAPDADLRRHHHVCLPAAEIAPDLALPPDGISLSDLAGTLGPPPRGFRVLP